MKIAVILIMLVIAAFSSGFMSIGGVKEETAEQIVVSPTPSPTPSIKPSIPFKTASLDENVLWELTQKWRVSEGLKQYTQNDRLCAIANDRVDDEKLDNHRGFKEKYHNGPYEISENLGTDVSEEKMLSGWLASPAHAQALRRPYTYSCISCKDDYCVQIFSNL